MMQSTSTSIHVAMIMDGNGRWATAQGLPRSAGHRAGANTVRRVVEACPDLGIGTLTVYAFSSDNWKRPRPEVRLLMQLLERYLIEERARCIANGVRVSVIGRRDRLSPEILRAIRETERLTSRGERLHFRIAVDYSARDAILQAAVRLGASGTPTRERFALLLAGEYQCEPAPDVDLLIRTGGEQRLSDFLLWECAYAELAFTKTMWPDLSVAEVETILADYRNRERRFGGLGMPAVTKARRHA